MNVGGTGVATRAAKEKQLWCGYVGTRISLHRTSKMGRHSEGNLTFRKPRLGTCVNSSWRARHGFETTSGLGAHKAAGLIGFDREPVPFSMES